MTDEILSLAKYLASSRAEFTLSEMNLYLSRKYEEKELYGILKPHLYDLDLFCDAGFKCQRIVRQTLPADEPVTRELEKYFKTPEMPAGIEKLVESYVERSCGKNWDRGKTAGLIRKNIVKQKEEYWKGKAQYPKIRIISYLLYHFPVYFCQYQYLLLDLFKNCMLTTKMSFLDAGAGPGTITLSTIDFLSKLLHIYSKKGIDLKLNIKICSIEQSKENIECYNELISEHLSRLQLKNASITVTEPVHASVENAKPPEDVDFIVFSYILAEMRFPPEERAGVVERIASGSKSPAIIIIEPADLVNSKALRVTQSVLIRKGFSIYSPCTLIWGAGCHCSDCWSFEQPGNIQVPGFMEKIARTEESYKYMNTDMKFSYVILRKEERAKHLYRAKGKFVRLANLKKHVEKKINIAASVMSGNLGDNETFVFKICDATTSIPCYAVLPAYHINDNNKVLLEAEYGDVVEIFSTLVRENKAFSSYNLLITRNTTVKITLTIS